MKCIDCEKELEAGMALYFCPNKECKRFGLATEVYKKGEDMTEEQRLQLEFINSLPTMPFDKLLDTFCSIAERLAIARYRNETDIQMAEEDYKACKREISKRCLNRN